MWKTLPRVASKWGMVRSKQVLGYVADDKGWQPNTSGMLLLTVVLSGCKTWRQPLTHNKPAPSGYSWQGYGRDMRSVFPHRGMHQVWTIGGYSWQGYGRDLRSEPPHMGKHQVWLRHGWRQPLNTKQVNARLLLLTRVWQRRGIWGLCSTQGYVSGKAETNWHQPVVTQQASTRWLILTRVWRRREVCCSIQGYGYGTTDVNHKNAASQHLVAIAAGYGRDIVLSN